MGAAPKFLVRFGLNDGDRFQVHIYEFAQSREGAKKGKTALLCAFAPWREFFHQEHLRGDGPKFPQDENFTKTGGDANAIVVQINQVAASCQHKLRCDANTIRFA